ncbi:MAG: glycosyltransferase [Nitrospirae bacterium]|nr:glycosyltransferase [Nitrospirota bacterium]
MNCLNCSKYLREAIDSVYAQTYKNWEIIFWDNVSTDDSAEIAKNYDDKLKYFRGEQTVPLYAARNMALRHARGEFIAFLDCDDIWLPAKLEKQMPLFSKESVGLVYSNTMLLNQKTGNEKILYKKKPPAGMIFRELLAGYFLSLETVVLRRKCFDMLSEWFDGRFNHVGDADLFIRVAFDWELEYIDEPLAKWRMYEESWTWKKIGLFGTEWRMLLDKYSSLFEGFGLRYEKEIKKINAMISYFEAVEEWKNNNRSRVRAIVGPHMLIKPKLFLVFLLSILPFEQFVKLLRFFGKHP